MRVSVYAAGMAMSAVVGQWVAAILLPKTAGFTKAVPTVLCCACFVFSAWAIARVIKAGGEVSIVLPLVAAIIPLGAVAIGVIVYGEPADLRRIALLLIACGLIGAAAILPARARGRASGTSETVRSERSAAR